MTTILAFAVVITILVLVHELGHFLAARWMGVPVEVFSVGFGPRVLSVRRSGIEYRLSAIPFGGYVKMTGASPTRAESAPGGFDSKAPWQRFIILFAGPAMNVGFALALATIALWCGIELPAYRSGPPVAGAVVEHSAAERAGIQAGDRVVAVDGRSVSSWSALEAQFVARRKQDLPLTLRRADTEITVVLPAEFAPRDLLSMGILPDAHPVVRSISRGGLADMAGLRTGDLVAAINGTPANLTTNLDKSVAQSASDQVSLTIIRDGHSQTVVVPGGARRSLGAVAAVPMALFRPEPLDAVILGTRAIAASSAEILKTIGGLFTGDISVRHLIGPVGLAQMAADSTQLGWRSLLEAMAFISLNLGLCNLLPIPILDGGHLLMLLVEGVTRRDVPFRLRKALVGAGAVAMLLLLFTTLYNDLGRLGLLPL